MAPSLVGVALASPSPSTQECFDVSLHLSRCIDADAASVGVDDVVQLTSVFVVSETWVVDDSRSLVERQAVMEGGSSCNVNIRLRPVGTTEGDSAGAGAAGATTAVPMSLLAVGDAADAHIVHSHQMSLLRLHNAHEVIKVRRVRLLCGWQIVAIAACTLSTLADACCAVMLLLVALTVLRCVRGVQTEIHAARAKEHRERLAEQSNSNLPPTLRSVRESLALKRAAQEREQEKARMLHLRPPTSVAALFHSGAAGPCRVTLVVCWRVEGSDRLGQLHLLDVPLVPGKMEETRSDVPRERRASHTVLAVPMSPVSAAGGGGAQQQQQQQQLQEQQGARLGVADAPPLSATCRAPPQVVHDFATGPAFIDVDVNVCHSVGGWPSTPLSFRVAAQQQGLGGRDFGAVPSASASVAWVGVNPKCVTALASGDTVPLRFVACVSAPGRYDLNRFVVEVRGAADTLADGSSVNAGGARATPASAAAMDSPVCHRFPGSCIVDVTPAP